MQYSRGLGTTSSRSLSRGGLAIILCAAIAAVLAGFVRASAPDLSGPSRLVGHPAPAFSLSGEQGGVTLSTQFRLSNLRGKPVVLVFFYSLCPACGDTAQSIERVAERNPGVSTLSIDSPAEGVTVADNYAQRLGLDAPVLLDLGGRVATTYHVSAYPVTIVIDSVGVVRGAWTGEVSETTVEGSLASLSAKP